MGNDGTENGMGGWQSLHMIVMVLISCSFTLWRRVDKWTRNRDWATTYWCHDKVSMRKNLFVTIQPFPKMEAPAEDEHQNSALMLPKGRWGVKRHVEF